MLSGQSSQEKSPLEIRRQFREDLRQGKLLRMPGAFSPFVALIIEQLGFQGVYISGAGVSNDLAYPDIGLTTLSEVADRAYAIRAATQLPTLLDIDTGFGESMNVARTVQKIEDLGVSGVHLEDQSFPKRCGHLDNKTLVGTDIMCQKIKAAVSAKRDKNFLVMARTDAAGSEGLESAIERAQAYVDAGADAIFPEALKSEKDFEAFRKKIKVPLLANMTEFGKSKLLNTRELESLGYNMVIYPMSAFRLAMKAVEDGLRELKIEDKQEALQSKMQTRARLYEILKYEEYNSFDKNIFNFTLTQRKD